MFMDVYEWTLFDFLTSVENQSFIKKIQANSYECGCYASKSPVFQHAGNWIRMAGTFCQ
jgi:hypothetical protein